MDLKELEQRIAALELEAEKTRAIGTASTS